MNRTLTTNSDGDDRQALASSGGKALAYYMYVSIQEEDRIAIFSVTPKTGKLKHQGDVELKGRPAPMAIDPDQKYLFAGRRKAGDFGMTSFSIALKQLGWM